MSCPSAIGDRSTSIGAPAATVEASGFIWEMKGQSVASPPTAAAAPVATKRKSRRVGCSAEEAVVTIPNPFFCCTGLAAPEYPTGSTRFWTQPAPADRAAAENPLFPVLSGETRGSESFYWHPCPASASPLSAHQWSNSNIRIPSQQALSRMLELKDHWQI